MTCPICDKREPRYPQVCEVCRARLAAQLWELTDLYSVASAALVPGSRAGQRVSGSRERGLPLSAGVVDLLTPVVRLGGTPVDSTRDTMVPKVRAWRTSTEVTLDDGQVVIVEQWHRELVTVEGVPVLVPAGDQAGTGVKVGEVLVPLKPVAVVLDSWVRDWIDIRAMRETRPRPVVPVMQRWLSNRLDWACSHHPAVADFAGEVTSALFALRAVLNVSRRKIRLKEPCPSCDMVLSLVRDPAGGKIVECQNCGNAWDDPAWLASVLAGEAA
jgi:ribosomal protein L37AE/L43A